MDPSLMRYALHTIAGHPGHEAFWSAVEALLSPEQRQRLAHRGDIRESTWSKAQEPPAPTAPPAPPATPRAVAVALPLVKEFEGCRLTAYPDPESGGKPWTIGWGSTSYANGSPVQPGDVISQEKADALLQLRLHRDWQGLMASDFHRIYSGLTANQQAALLSFTYNCGPNWFGADGFATLTRCLKAGQLDKVPGILLLYVNPGGPSEAGLRRRRRAEGALWNAQ
jgi:GH24 family phage-related lysozyme (muramidase)